jgi:heme A synthase
MGFFITVHRDIMPALIWLFGGAAAIWGGVLVWRRRPVDQALRALLLGTVAVGVLQGIVGGILFLSGLRPPGGSLSFLHYVYGGIVIVAIPIAFTYTENKSQRRDMIIFVIAAVIVVAAAARAFMTGIGLP